MQKRRLSKITLVYGIITAFLCLISYFFIDRILALFIQQNLLDYRFVYTIGKLLGKIFDPSVWAVVFIILFLCTMWQFFILKKPNKRLYVFTLSLFIAIVVASILKYTLARYRPDLYLQYGQYGFHWFSRQHDFNSFPSGHAVLNFAGLLALGYFLNRKKCTYIFIALALIITLSRVMMDAHFLSDIFAGSYIGIFSYLWAKSLLEPKD
ncbi:phosphatase PAP2 family protein [Facilibium subflavum]|uniref:phosphatase PAP2 family protein n=1 Tax=Facilibium subflavum TaxID=2219058 RepID=UPI000E64BE78|nr:phosphatase PAP2 family protein [Facilibium subflavum]